MVIIKLVLDSTTKDGEKNNLEMDINYMINTEFSFKTINEKSAIPFEKMPEQEMMKLFEKIMNLDFFKTDIFQ